MNENKSQWAHTVTIIAVNIALFAIGVQISLANMASIAQVNARTDQVQQRTDAIQLMIYDTLKELKK